MASRDDVRRGLMPFAAMWVVFLAGCLAGVAFGSLWPLVIGIVLSMFAPYAMRARSR
jgi:hypothetical protein